MVLIIRTKMAFARGAQTGVVMIVTLSAAKTAWKEAGVLGFASADGERDRGRVVGEIHQEVARLLGHSL